MLLSLERAVLGQLGVVQRTVILLFCRGPCLQHVLDKAR